MRGNFTESSGNHSLFKKSTLDNGVRVLSEHYPHSRCLIMGFWIHMGTRFEKKEQMGVSHLLEHMVFKGTEKYNAFELARCLEARGGEINAFTAREHTCFHTSCLKEDMDLSVDVLSQICAFASFDESSFRREKQVIQQEILMATDDLEEYIYDLYYENIFPDNPLGYQILGSMKSLKSLSLNHVRDHYDQYFVPENMIVTAVGSVDHGTLVASVEKHLSKKKWKGKTRQESSLITPPEIVINDFFVKDCEQYHILMGFPACSYSDPSRFNHFVVNTALGGGMTSRFYQCLREERGLAYSVFSVLNTFTDTGLQTVYVGTEKRNVMQVVDLIKKELKELRQEGLNREDIELYKTQAKGEIIIGAEDFENRMNSLAINEMIFGEYRSVDQVICDIDKVNKDSVMESIRSKLDPENNLSFFLLGPEPITP